MPFTIVEDEGTLHVRAIVSSSEEAIELIDRLAGKCKSFQFITRPEPQTKETTNDK